VLAECVTKEEILESFLPLLLKSFECGVPKLQILSLQKTPVDFLFIQIFIKKLEYMHVKNMLLPRILKMSGEGSLSIKKQGLLTLNKIYNYFDKNELSEQIIQALIRIRKQENDKEINFIICTIFDGISKLLDIEVLINNLRPSDTNCYPC